MDSAAATIVCREHAAAGVRTLASSLRAGGICGAHQVHIGQRDALAAFLQGTCEWPVHRADRWRWWAGTSHTVSDGHSGWVLSVRVRGTTHAVAVVELEAKVR